MEKIAPKNDINVQTGFIIIFAATLFFMKLYSYNLFHSILELFITVTAVVIFIISYNSKKYIEDNFLIILGALFFYIAILKVLHILSYKGMGVFIGFDSNLPTQFWMFSRYLESLSLLFAIWYSSKKRINYTLLHLVYIAIIAVFLFSVFAFRNFPACYIDGVGLTTFKNVSEYIVICIFIIAIINFRKIKDRFSSKLYKFIMVYIVLNAICDSLFTLYSDVYGLINFAGHYLNLIAFIFLYKVYVESGLKNPYETIFITLKLKEEELIKDRNIIAMKNTQLEKLLDDLKRIQSKLVQSERLVAIGQLAAGVAHEINNPLGFVIGNTDTLEEYVKRYREVLNAYKELMLSQKESADTIELKEKFYRVEELEKDRKLDYISEDLDELFRETTDGLSRISKIVKALRLFSRIDEPNEISEYDMNFGIKTTVLLAKKEIENYAKVESNLADLPIILANGGEINQALLNIIINSVQAIEAKNSSEEGIIKINTWVSDGYVNCSIEDNGIGIKEKHIGDIFNPFFTTKKAGEGTGLGLSISYDIIVIKHKGKLLVESKEGIGTKFTLSLPI